MENKDPINQQSPHTIEDMYKALEYFKVKYGKALQRLASWDEYDH